MIFDPNKNMEIFYNYLNLPVRFVQDDTELKITYDANGLKLSKERFVGDQKVDSTYYVNGLEYEADTLIIHHTDGIVKKKPDNTVEYYYYFKNYRNDVIFFFRDENGDGIISALEREEHHYYPYGMEIDGIWMKTKEKNDYLFGSKEHDNFSGMDDFGARFLDASIPYWGQIDPLASLMPAWSPYSYAANNPITYSDPTGMVPERTNTADDDQGDPPWIEQARKLYYEFWEKMGFSKEDAPTPTETKQGLAKTQGEIESFMDGAEAVIPVISLFDPRNSDNVGSTAMNELIYSALPGIKLGKGVVKGVSNVIPTGKLANHLFKGAGKLTDNPANRALIHEISNGASLGIDVHGKSWFTGMDSAGKTIYSYARNGVIKGAGYMTMSPAEMIIKYGLK